MSSGEWKGTITVFNVEQQRRDGWRGN